MGSAHVREARRLCIAAFKDTPKAPSSSRTYCAGSKAKCRQAKGGTALHRCPSVRPPNPNCRSRVVLVQAPRRARITRSMRTAWGRAPRPCWASPRRRSDRCGGWEDRTGVSGVLWGRHFDMWVEGGWGGRQSGQAEAWSSVLGAAPASGCHLEAPTARQRRQGLAGTPRLGVPR